MRAPTARPPRAPSSIFDDISARPLPARYELRLGEPLDDLTTPVAAACRVADRENANLDLYALMGDPDLPPRGEAIERLDGISHANLVNQIAVGRVAGAGDRGLHQAVVYERPRGGPLARPDRVPTLDEDALRVLVIAPLCAALRALHNRGVVHRGVRPDNLYFLDAVDGRVGLGDCIIGVPGQAQPLAYEPIERASAPALGRGIGGPEADLYALGVTVLAFLGGAPPGQGLDDVALLRARLDRGTQGALVGGRRFSPRLDTLVGGLLADQIEARWGLDNLDEWLKGERVAINLFLRAERAEKPFRFDGHDCHTTRTVAEAFNSNQAETLLELRSERLEGWLSGELDEPDLAANIAARRRSMSTSRGLRAYPPDELIARVCIDLDPSGPIRYRGMTVTFDGIGPLLAAAVATGDEALANTLAAMISAGLPIAWIEALPERRKHLVHRVAQYIRLQRYLAHPALGFGIERCLYDLNPGLRCFSPLVAAARSHTPKTLLRALDKGEGKGGDWIDPHVAGFIAAALHPKAEATLAETPQPGRPRSVRAMTGLVLHAVAQKATRAGPLPNLARAMREPLVAIIKGLHGRSRRKGMTTALDDAIARGDLPAMLALLGDRRTRTRDRRAYADAVIQYARLSTAIDRVRRGGRRRRQRAAVIGHRLAARIAYLALGITVAAVTVGYVV